MSYIDRELLLIGVDGCISSLRVQAKGDPIQEVAIKLVEATRNYIASLPATDVAPVRHGRWKNGGNGLYDTCTACGEEIYLAIPMNYCPNCGARMGKEAGNEATKND